jgi:hypothetical protein
LRRNPIYDRRFACRDRDIGDHDIGLDAATARSTLRLNWQRSDPIGRGLAGGTCAIRLQSGLPGIGMPDALAGRKAADTGNDRVAAGHKTVEPFEHRI